MQNLEEYFSRNKEPLYFYFNINVNVSSLTAIWWLTIKQQIEFTDLRLQYCNPCLINRLFTLIQPKDCLHLLREIIYISQEI